MLTYNFDKRGSIPLYEFLYKNIKEEILSGKFKADEKLPSKRNLAQHLKLSVVTVENAYTQLILEGYIYSVEKRGYFICDLDEITSSVQTVRRTKSENSINKNNYLVDLTSNNISSIKFPFSVWSKLMREIISDHNTRLLDAAPYSGVKELRSAISDYLYNFRGMSVSHDQIIIGAGTEYLYSLIIQLLGRKKIYAIENPGYQKIAKIYKYNDVDYKYVDLDEYGISASKLNENCAQIVHISPSHHFPTGVVMPIKRRNEILKWANDKSDRYIIEDDYDSEFRFTGRPIQTLQCIDKNEKVIYINTFSKSIAPSIRISYMVLPYSLLKLYKENLSFYACTVPSFEQFTLAKFISDGYYEQHINRMRNYYKKHRDFIIKSIKASSFGEKVTILEENSGLHFLLSVNTNLEDAELKRLAAKKGIKISFLSEYYHNRKSSPQHIIVINYSGVDSDRIPIAVERLSALL
ncbi:PLP-dependent aminotransferase family protein [Lacrimispora sp. 38-1]|uniref:MocR-like pyridoxine biosynthesis transcription factor PdxR n=1 Tax=Lacrimispora sp. 38-1 TaxID=3125778 RepID=UPI003CF832FF